MERDLEEEPERLPLDRVEPERLEPERELLVRAPVLRDPLDERLDPDDDPERDPLARLDAERLDAALLRDDAERVDEPERDDAEPERDRLEDPERDRLDAEAGRELLAREPALRDLLDERLEPFEELRERLDDVRLELDRDVPLRRSAAGISSLATALASCGICFSRNLAIRSSSRRIPRASLAVSLSLTASASASIPV